MASADTYQQITEAASKKGHKTVSVRVDQGVLDMLRPIATRNRRSLSAELSIAIEDHVQRELEHYRAEI
jgi:predicted transcriptional regulator